VGVAAKLYVPAVAAVPVMVQFEFRVSPEPVKLPDVSAQLSGEVPPVIASVCEYDVPAGALGNVVVVMDGVGLMVRETVTLPVPYATVKENEPATAVPDKTPVEEFRLSPDPVRLPDEIVKVPELQPDSVNVWETSCPVVYGPTELGDIVQPPEVPEPLDCVSGWGYVYGV
jgi:hypothetical protein